MIAAGQRFGLSLDAAEAWADAEADGTG